MSAMVSRSTDGPRSATGVCSTKDMPQVRARRKCHARSNGWAAATVSGTTAMFFFKDWGHARGWAVKS